MKNQKTKSIEIKRNQDINRKLSLFQSMKLIYRRKKEEKWINFDVNIVEIHFIWLSVNVLALLLINRRHIINYCFKRETNEVTYFIYCS